MASATPRRSDLDDVVELRRGIGTNLMEIDEKLQIIVGEGESNGAEA